MEKNIKRQIANAAEAVKKKVRKMRDIETEKSSILESVFKPITNPLNKMMEKEKKYPKRLENVFLETSSPLEKDKTLKRESDIGFNVFSSGDKVLDGSEESSEDSEKSDCEVDTNNDSFKTVESGSSDHSFDISSWSKSSENLKGIPFGVRNERGKLMMGATRVGLHDDYIQVGANKYKITSGINELLFKKVPDLSMITDEDIRHYKLMLLETNAHRRDYDPLKPIKSNRGRKYLNIIKPLFKLRKVSASTDTSQPDTHEGQGLSILKKWKKNVDYVYWDDPNELIDRLKLLIASKDAGNTGLDNEIISIVEELRESGIIPNK